MACIPSDPDISGIGVRIAIYAQNLFTFIPIPLIFWDDAVSVDEIGSIETPAITILVTAFAISISAMVEARTVGLSNFHASIVLNLSWMNNTNTFIYFLVYAQNKGHGEISMNLSSWIKHGWETLWASPTLDSSNPRGQLAGTGILIFRTKNLNSIPGQSRRMQSILKRIVLVLGSLHLSLMAAFGIWLWRNPRLFGTRNTCAVEHASIFILGHPVPLGSGTLRVCSLVIYSVLLVPGLNLIPPMAFFLSIFRLYGAWRRHQNSDSHLPTVFHNTMPSVIGMLLLFAIDLIFLIDIELTLRENQRLQISGPGESAWTFGQILAVLLLVLPLRDLGVLGAIFGRRNAPQDEARRRQELSVELTAVLRNAQQDKQSAQEIADLVENGADANVQVEGLEYATALQLASSREDTELVARLLDRGANPDIQGGEYGTALQAASYQGSQEICKLLLDKGAKPNIQGGKYGIALQAASAAGHLDLVQLLLDKKADPNIQGGQHGTALQAAYAADNQEIVRLLLERGAADPNASRASLSNI